MSIYLKVLAVERLFKQLDSDISDFKRITGLDCFHGCGLCCQKPDIDATVLEFLPFAYHLYKEGKARAMFEKLQTLEDKRICVIYKDLPTATDRGLCTSYNYRGMICRLFGYSAMIDKYGDKKLVTCRRIKEESKEQYDAAVTLIANGAKVPILSQYGNRLQYIDHHLANRRMPINDCIKEALVVVLNYYSYRKSIRQT